MQYSYLNQATFNLKMDQISEHASSVLRVARPAEARATTAAMSGGNMSQDMFPGKDLHNNTCFGAV